MSDLHVIFGTGPLGRTVMNELVRRGERVRLINRSGRIPEAPSGVEVITADAYDVSATRRVTQGAAVVYQCAQPGYTRWPDLFPPLQAAILEGAAAAGAKFIIAENLYMYGEVAGPLHEGLPYQAHTRKGRVRAAMAEAALAAHQAGRVRVAIGRGSDFFGPWVLGAAAGDRVFYPAIAGKAAQFGGRLDVPHTQTYIEDFGRALVILGEREEALGQAWHVPNDRPNLTQREFADLIAQALGKPVKASGMGRFMLRLGGLFIPEAREMVEMMYEFEKPFVVDSSRFERAFGMRATPIAEAVRITLDWYRAHPQNG